MHQPRNELVPEEGLMFQQSARRALCASYKNLRHNRLEGSAQSVCDPVRGTGASVKKVTQLA